MPHPHTRRRLWIQRGLSHIREMVIAWNRCRLVAAMIKHAPHSIFVACNYIKVQRPTGWAATVECQNGALLTVRLTMLGCQCCCQAASIGVVGTSQILDVQCSQIEMLTRSALAQHAHVCTYLAELNSVLGRHQVPTLFLQLD
eukprot:COSAG05_NODE_31_length_28416_cov_170.150652_10_plen_143_part_00